MKVEPCFAAVDITRLPNFTPEEMDLISVFVNLAGWLVYMVAEGLGKAGLHGCWGFR